MLQPPHTRMVLGINYRADPIGPTHSALAIIDTRMGPEACKASAPLHSTPHVWSSVSSRPIQQAVHHA